jgi:type IV pilus assembly protein PilP
MRVKAGQSSMRRKAHYYFSFVLLVFVSLLNGCAEEASSEMKYFVERLKSQPVRPIQELPSYKPFEPVPFTAQNLRSPFEPLVGGAIEKVAKYAKLTPDSKRPREALEAYPLDALRMVGTIARAGSIFALVQDNQGIVHRVGIGNYMGQNFGKIIKVTDKSIELEELILEGPEFVKRNVTMRLAE